MADQAGPPADDRRSEPVLDWLDEVAAAEGLSREAAVEYLISSYWRLEEIVDLLEAGDGEHDDAAGIARSEVEPASSDVEALHERFDTLLSDLRRREEGPDDREALLSSVLELGDRLERLEETLAAGAGPGRPEPALTDGLSALRDRLDSVETAVDAVEGDVATGAASRQQLADRLAALEGVAVSEEAFETFADRTESRQRDMGRHHDALRASVRTEFDHIRTVLVHLLDEPDTDGGTLGTIGRELAAFRADREAVASLTRAANRQGTREASCEHCGAAVDLGLLRTPICPVCEQRFTDLETTQRFLGMFDTHRLRVEGGPDAADGER